ncbi:hypothetical protein KKD57_05375, partial [Patescibacteria group bacterium]|nr:hypothetical protein [Patescibacteria group bacterium]
MRCPRTGRVGQGQHLLWQRISLCEIRPPIPPKKRQSPPSPIGYGRAGELGRGGGRRLGGGI